jgi:hypothetical protein
MGIGHEIDRARVGVVTISRPYRAAAYLALDTR